MEKKFWDKATSGEDIYIYALENKNGMRVEVSNFGATILGLYVPDKKGKIEDVVMGYDDLASYYKNWHSIGQSVGPNANRIANAKFSLSGKEYQLQAGNDGHNLHSHFTLSYQKRIWLVKQYDEQAITFMCECSDCEMGFPGNKVNEITFTLTEDNEVKIHYHVTTDKETIVNMTNHSYFNLSGNLSSTVKKHKLWLSCSHYTPIDESMIPTGEIADVKDTPMDFTTEKMLGEAIDSDFSQIKQTSGLDHNFCIDDWDGRQKKVASLYEEKSGRYMEVYTDLPGMQIYTANYIGICLGKKKKVYKTHGAVCMETQYFPNHINEENFVSAIFDEQNPYDSTTIFKFSVR